MVLVCPLVRFGSTRFSRNFMIQPQGTRLVAGLFCQCRSAETHAGVDPGGGCGPAPVSPQPPQDSRSGSDIPDQACDVCGGPEQEHRLKVLFEILDVNGDGGICVNDLSIGLKKLGVHRTEHELRVRVRSGRVRDGSGVRVAAQVTADVRVVLENQPAMVPAFRLFIWVRFGSVDPNWSFSFGNKL